MNKLFCTSLRLPLLLRILQIQSLNLDPGTGYPEDFHNFPQVIKANGETIP
jgi:hypothetical protein